MSSIFELFGSIVLDTSGAEKALAKVSKAGQKVGSVLGKGFKLAGQAALQSHRRGRHGRHSRHGQARQQRHERLRQL